jgi:hypothetical protein
LLGDRRRGSLVAIGEFAKYPVGADSWPVQREVLGWQMWVLPHQLQPIVVE